MGNSQKITGLLEQLTALPAFTNDSIERLVGTDEDNTEFKNSYSTEGNIAIRSLINCDNLLVYLGFNGINWFDGVNSGIFSKALNEYIKTNINDTYRHLSCATYFDDKYLLCYPKGSSTTPSETIYLDLKNKTYGIYSYSFSCFSLWNRGTDGLRLFGGSNTEGRIYEVNTGLDDDTANIEAYDKIEPLNFGNPDRYKQIYHFYIKMKTTTGTALRIYYILDNSEETYKDLTLTASTTKWYKIDFSGGGQRCREIAIRPRMNDKYYFEIQGYAIVFEEEAPEWS